METPMPKPMRESQGSGAVARVPAPRKHGRAIAKHGAWLERGGLIAVGGPPLGGKSVLAAHLAECLPYAVKCEVVDDLSGVRASRLPRSPGGPVAHVGTAALLQHARAIWRARMPGTAPTILVVARFGTAAARRQVRAVARAMGARFLFVEACSRNERALRRIPMSFLSRDELRARLARYDAALRAYEPVDAAEAVALPALRLGRVHADLERALDRVLAAW